MVGVLRVSKVRAGGADYYLGVAAGSGTGIEAAGRWMGAGTPELRLSGVVEGADLEAVLAGEDPGTGQVLGTARRQVTVAGFDMTFSAPKSVSLLHALGDSEVGDAVSAGHAGAVEAAMSYVGRHALAVRRRPVTLPVPVPTTVTGVAAAGFVHRTSRALDPHLHTGREGGTHAGDDEGAAQGPEDGGTKAGREGPRTGRRGRAPGARGRAGGARRARTQPASRGDGRGGGREEEAVRGEAEEARTNWGRFPSVD